LSGSTDPQELSEKQIVSAQAIAESEVKRLNGLNADKNCTCGA